MERVYGYERQPYDTRLETTIVQVGQGEPGPFAILADTLLYPAGGGQPSDRGTVAGVVVRAVEKIDGDLIHWLERPVEPGAATVELDWPRRYDHMQQHTAQHVLTRTALDEFGWTTRSFHIGPETSDIELDCPPPEASVISRLEDAVARHIASARPIRSYRVSEEELSTLAVRSRGLPANHSGDIRLVEIRGLDLNTCGGTHLQSTAEIESLKVIRGEPLRGGCRLHWVAGRRLRQRLEILERRASALRKLLDTGDEAILDSIQRKMEQLSAERRARRRLEVRLADLLADQLVASGNRVVELHLAPPEASLLRPVAESFVTRAETGVALLTAGAEADGLFVLAAAEESGLDVLAAGRRVASILEGKGGGAGQLFQGRAAALTRRDEALAALREIVS